MRPAGWLERLYSLLVRFPQHGVSADIAALSAAELWGLYRFLSRVSDGA